MNIDSELGVRTLHFAFNLICSLCVIWSQIRNARFERIAFDFALTIPGVEHNTYITSIPPFTVASLCIYVFYVLE